MLILMTFVEVEMVSGRNELGFGGRGFFIDKEIFILWSGDGKRDEERNIQCDRRYGAWFYNFAPGR